jgi:malate/lactate dehydrogenase
MKVSIIGAAGCVGSSAAFNIATQGLADEMVLADIRQNWLEHHFIDIVEAAVARDIDMSI